MSPTTSDPRAAVKERFAPVAASPLHGSIGYHTSPGTEGAVVSDCKPA
jgi:hypothetical protein